MAQIAQQDNLIIEITGALAAMDETTKQKLIDCIKVGTITDVTPLRQNHRSIRLQSWTLIPVCRKQ